MWHFLLVKHRLCTAPAAYSEKLCYNRRLGPAFLSLFSKHWGGFFLFIVFSRVTFLALQEHPPAINHLDSSSNPSSTTSSTPSSPAPFQSSNPPSATPPPNPSPMGQRDGRFNFPGKLFQENSAKIRKASMQAEADQDFIGSCRFLNTWSCLKQGVKVYLVTW